jgi:hypothetical protein
MMVYTDTQREQQAAETPPETQRNLTLTILGTAAAIEVMRVVVPDAYGAAKGAVHKGVDKLKGPEAGPPRKEENAE